MGNVFIASKVLRNSKENIHNQHTCMGLFTYRKHDSTLKIFSFKYLSDMVHAVYTTPGYASLLVLEVGWNPIGDNGISLLVEGLKDNDVLVDLSAPSCEITAKDEITCTVLQDISSI